ncbi:hypothetical protein K474DRAFT_1664769 [Panus rudis PR-1116 ss-1]|nr:hypothetical protein K474DRAFT_1664769 [Panus rudis PR-1116 ss-1]
MGRLRTFERPQAAVHRVLLCVELLEHILRCIKYIDPKERYRDLRSMALVCKTISPIALTRLWEKLDTMDAINHLLKLQPDAQPSKYAQSVRSLILILNSEDLEQSWARLPAPLFPRLGELRLVLLVKADDSIQPIISLLSPTVSQLAIYVKPCLSTAEESQLRTSLMDFLIEVKRTCCNLMTFDLYKK